MCLQAVFCNRFNEAGFLFSLQTSTSDQLLSPLRPAMTVSVPQGASSSRSDGNQEPTDLTENRIYVRKEGVFSAQVCPTVLHALDSVLLLPQLPFTL